jgi:glycosyltransferase involved in cell wall biosynthesis
VLPAYNEADVIGKVVKNTIRAFKTSPYEATVLVVNDGSKDATANVASKYGAVVVNHILNFGAGSATATGLSYAQQNNFDIACTMDADGQHDPSDVLKGVDRLIEQKTDLLIGSRLLNNEGMSKVKVLGNRGLSFITYLIFGINSTDSQSGLRIFSRKALEQLRWKTSGYEFCSEMLWRAKQLHLDIEEYPIQAIYTEYSKSKGQNNWNAINIIKSLLKRRFAELLG